jgi:hypothetical protein
VFWHHIPKVIEILATMRTSNLKISNILKVGCNLQENTPHHKDDVYGCNHCLFLQKTLYKKKTPLPVVCKRTIPTKRLPLVGEVSANFSE